MALVELIFDIKDPSFLAGNVNVPKAGEPIFLNDGRYAFGNNATPFKDLVFFGQSASGFLPYVGANANLNMGTYGISAGSGVANFVVDTHGIYANGKGNTLGNNVFGYEALFLNTTGAQNTAFGHQNLANNTTGNNNSAFGFRALLTNIVGGFNSAVGMQSLVFNTSGSYNSAIGYNSMFSNTVGSQNSAFGFNALFGNISGNYNSALGTNSLYANTTGSYNFGLGYNAGRQVTTGNFNTFIGYLSGQDVVTGGNNVFIGTTPSLGDVSDNVVISDGNGNLRYRFDGIDNNFYQNLNVPSIKLGTSSTVGHVLTAIDTIGNLALQAPSGGGYTRLISTIAINTSAGSSAKTDYYYECTSNLTLTLPTAVGNTNEYTIKNNGGTPTINTTSSQTIDGGLTAILSTPYSSITLYSNNSNWLIK